MHVNTLNEFLGIYTYIYAYIINIYTYIVAIYTEIPKHAGPTDKSGKNQFGRKNIDFHWTDCPV